MKILTAAEMRQVDRLTTERYGIASLQLMEQAGRGVAAWVARRFGPLDRKCVVILCGRGNNGGDGLVAARELLRWGARPEVYVLARAEDLRGDAAVNLERWLKLGPARFVPDTEQWLPVRERLERADLVIDALLGTGLRGPAEGLLATAIEEINRVATRARVVAVDIPSGMSSDTGDSVGPVVQADLTVTFTAPKRGQVLLPNAERVGELVVHAIGSPAELVEQMPSKLRWSEPGEFAVLRLRRPRNAHKGTFGHVLVVAGSVGKAGAAGLAGLGALRAGAGLVTVATPAPALATVASFAPELMTEPLPATATGGLDGPEVVLDVLRRLWAQKTVLAVGPGLGQAAETRASLQALVPEVPSPLILDADGLNAFAGCADRGFASRAAPLAVTPHPGEMARLLDCAVSAVQSRRLEVALEAAQRWRACVILKGFRTIVASPAGEAFVNSTGNPGMATAGTGDVLTGILAGLTAQWGTHQWERVLALGVYLHGLAGDLAAAEGGEISLTATDLLAYLPRAFQHLLAAEELP